MPRIFGEFTRFHLFKLHDALPNSVSARRKTQDAMEYAEFEVSGRDGRVLSPYLGRIESCFGVRVQCENVGVPSRDQVLQQSGLPCDEQGSVNNTHFSAAVEQVLQGEGEEKEGGPILSRTRIKLSSQSHYSFRQAKSFMEAIITERAAGVSVEQCERHLTLSPDQFDAMLGIHHAVQHETKTVFLFEPEAHTISILGAPAAVKRAQTLATQRLLGGCSTDMVVPSVVAPSIGGSSISSTTTARPIQLSPTHHRKSRLARRSGLTVKMAPMNTGGGGGEDDVEVEAARVMHTLSLSPGADSAPDSCYDSDGSRSGSRRSSCTRSELDLHSDVSRTVSDTLAAEHTDNEFTTSYPATTTATATTCDHPTPSFYTTNAPYSCSGEPSLATSSHKLCSSIAAGLEDVVRNGDSEEGDTSISTSSNALLVKQETLEFAVCDSNSDKTSLLSASEGNYHQNTAVLVTAAANTLISSSALSSGGGGETTGAAAQTDENHNSPSQQQQQQQQQQKQQQQQQQNNQTESDFFLQAVRYGIRLGYSQELTKRVLGKLGPDVGKDDLLQELIRHSQMEEDVDDEEELKVNNTLDERDCYNDYEDYEEDNDEPVLCPWVLPTNTSAIPPGSAATTTAAAANIGAPSSCSPSELKSLASSSDKDREDTIDGRVSTNMMKKVTGGGHHHQGLLRGPEQGQLADKDPAGTISTNNLRHIIIDGSNIAMSHGNKQIFSCRGIRLAVDYFQDRGHNVTVFVPSWRKEASRQDTQIVDQELLYELERDGTLVFTPSRWVSGKRIVCYDDLYIIKLAAEEDGVVVSNDNYRDLITKSPEYKKVIEERLLMYSFVNDRFMPPDDPLGRRGPSLDNFLSKQPVQPEALPPPCPYAKKCTYGNKCKYYHPERGTAPRKSVVETIQEKERAEIAKANSGYRSRETSPGDRVSRGKSPTSEPVKKPLCKSKSVTTTKPVVKRALGRTQSLAPGALQGNRTVGSKTNLTISPPDSLSLQPKVDDLANDPTKADGLNTCHVTVTAATPTDTTAAAAIERSRQESYDNRLDKFRREIELAESEQQHVRKEKLSRKSSAPVSMSSGSKKGQSQEVFKVPLGWSATGQPILMDINQASRQAVADKQHDAYLDSGFGHLALAKKLSNEGSEDEKRRMSPEVPKAPVKTPLSRHASEGCPPTGKDERKPKNNGHRQLERQLSLKGSDDPRLSIKPIAKATQSNPIGLKQKTKEKRQLSQQPKVVFHGGSTVQLPPKPNKRQQEESQKIHWGHAGVTYTFSEPGEALQQRYPPPQHMQHPQLQHRQISSAIGQHPGHSQLTRHSSLGGEHLFIDQRRLMHQHQQQQQQQQQQAMHLSEKPKQPVGRMASAPGTYSYFQNQSQRQQQRPSNTPMIHRQNSTSDPQLHIQPDDIAAGQFDVLDSHVAASRMYSQTGSGVPTPPTFAIGGSASEMSSNSNVMWTQGGLPFEGNNMPPVLHHHSPSASFDNPIHPSASFEDINTGILTGMDRRQSQPFYPPYHPLESLGTSSPTSSQQSLLISNRMTIANHGENMSTAMPGAQIIARNSSPDLYKFGSQANMSQPSPPQLSPSGQHHLATTTQQQQQQQQQQHQHKTHQVHHQDLYSQQLGQQQQQQQQQQHQMLGNIPHQSIMLGQESGLLATIPSPPHPDEQTPSLPVHQQEGIASQRHKLFFHLCGLFPESDVRQAMLQHPHETKPDKLLAYIMTIRSMQSSV